MRLVRLAQEPWDALGRGWAAFLSEALTADEKSRLTVQRYNGYSPYQRLDDSLEPWERTWFTRRLPRPPAHLLLGACGAGRELHALVDEGFRVDAFEPATELAEATRRRVGERARVLAFRYEDLSGAVLDGAGRLGGIADQRYDAVLLGLGSLSHVLDPGERMRLFRTLDRLCPAGPLLASFWCAGRTIERRRLAGRIAAGGQALGRAAARLRGIAGRTAAPQFFGVRFGFACAFERGEVEALGAAIGRTVLWEDDGTESPHATFLRPSAPPT
jgi:hypothetical protein